MRSEREFWSPGNQSFESFAMPFKVLDILPVSLTEIFEGFWVDIDKQ